MRSTPLFLKVRNIGLLNASLSFVLVWTYESNAPPLRNLCLTNTAPLSISFQFRKATIWTEMSVEEILQIFRRYNYKFCIDDSFRKCLKLACCHVISSCKKQRARLINTRSLIVRKIQGNSKKNLWTEPGRSNTSLVSGLWYPSTNILRIFIIFGFMLSQLFPWNIQSDAYVLVFSNIDSSSIPVHIKLLFSILLNKARQA